MNYIQELIEEEQRLEQAAQKRYGSLFSDVNHREHWHYIIKERMQLERKKLLYRFLQYSDSKDQNFLKIQLTF